MRDFSLILNTGIQIHELEEELVLDLNSNVMKALRFFEFQIKGKIYLDPVYYFPMKDKYLRRNDLICAGYLNPVTNEMVEESEINNNMNWLDDTKLLSVNRLNLNVGDKKKSGLEQVENHWLPMPFFEQELSGAISEPLNWCRIKLIPIEEKSNSTRRVYRVLMALDTTENLKTPRVSPHFNGQPFKNYSLCGISHQMLDQLTDVQCKQYKSMLIPMKAYEFCDPSRNPLLDQYLRNIFSCTELARFEAGQRLKYLVYYTYLISYLHNVNALPNVKLYNDCGKESIHTNLIIDVGNSRTFGLVAEDPLDMSFSKSSNIELRDLEKGFVYSKPFDMRLCFKDERFDFCSGDDQFNWPSIVRLGLEASRNIYSGEQDLLSPEQFDTSHSSPKRFLWDHKAYKGQWKFVSEKDRVVGPSKTVFKEGLSQQFRSDGSFTPDPSEFGYDSSYSRCSLMTLCFIEILLQVRMQINGVKFREKNGSEMTKREIKRVIITCPTAMPREEQITLRKCMEEASTVLKRFYSNTYEDIYNAEVDQDKVTIIPSVQDLSKNAEMYDMRKNWNFDEATCCQMVYLYSELRRYLGNSQEYFSLYGKRRNGERNPSLTVASIDIGAGTTDIMICNYKSEGESVVPMPLFWDSFHLAGDDLINRIIIDVILEGPKAEYPGASGVITHKLQELGQGDISNKMHHFFGDGQSMGVIEKRMRKEFCVQVLIPVANYLLDLLQREQPDCYINYNDVFVEGKPAKCLMDFFATQMGFRFEDLTLKFSSAYLNEIVCKVFEPVFRKYAAIFYSYKCDIVLMGGRPCSLKQINRLLCRLYAVAPNRLISMNDYRVGSWYPGSDDIGNFGDKKSMVAVGALIAYLAETGKLHMFKLNTELLKTKVLPTSDYIGLMNTYTGTLDNILTPILNNAPLAISAFPQQLGCRQLDVPGYPAQLMYNLEFNDENIRKKAIENLKRQMGLPDDAPESALSPDFILNEMETLKYRIKANSPLHFRLEREFYEDKELIKIESVENNVHDELSKHLFKLSQQSWAEDESSWLDSGKFIMYIGL